MRSKFIKLTQAALWLAMAFTFGCSFGDSGNSIESGTFTDNRDDKVYKWVKIGGQVWMAENLNYETEGSKCYNNSPANCDKYGRMYNWDAAMEACPGDWRLPSNEDWNILMKFVNPSCSDNTACPDAGTKLKATHGYNNNGNGTDDYGFSVLPGGYGFAESRGGGFGGAGDFVNLWTSTEEIENKDPTAWKRDLGYNYKDLRASTGSKYYFYSVRCVRNY